MGECLVVLEEVMERIFFKMQMGILCMNIFGEKDVSELKIGSEFVYNFLLSK